MSSKTIQSTIVFLERIHYKTVLVIDLWTFVGVLLDKILYKYNFSSNLFSQRNLSNLLTMNTFILKFCFIVFVLNLVQADHHGNHTSHAHGPIVGQHNLADQPDHHDEHPEHDDDPDHQRPHPPDHPEEQLQEEFGKNSIQFFLTQTK